MFFVFWFMKTRNELKSGRTFSFTTPLHPSYFYQLFIERKKFLFKYHNVHIFYFSFKILITTFNFDSLNENSQFIHLVNFNSILVHVVFCCFYLNYAINLRTNFSYHEDFNLFQL